MLIGIMQGRLLPKVNNEFQAFPGVKWKDEFILASKIGLDLIEFIFDEVDINDNPLLTKKGLDAIIEVTSLSGIVVRSVCADYFMKFPLYELSNKKNLELMKILINNCKYVGVKEIVLPLVDKSKLNSINKINDLIYNLNNLKKILQDSDVTICLETDLIYSENKKLIKKLDSENIRLNYDTGNSASLGFNNLIELKNNSHIISNYHIKDRKYKQESVILGDGDYDFDIFFKLIKDKVISPKYLVVQAYRDEEGIDIFKKQFDWLKNKIKDLD